jgi:hypothetical protein
VSLIIGSDTPQFGPGRALEGSAAPPSAGLALAGALWMFP